MKKGNTNHQEEKGRGPTVEELQQQLNIPFSKSRADVWEEMESRLVEKTIDRKISIMASPIFRYAMAASIVFVLGLTGVMRFYSVTQDTLPGQHLVVSLPDGSTVNMNASSTLSYHPYWWRFSRSLSFQGEAYFEVEKGSRFTVQSEKGETSVLGTSFNIYSRNENYRVACFTGKVRVTSHKISQTVVLTPNEMAEMNPTGGLDVLQNANVKAETAWVNNEFVFTSVPLKEVMEEIERQYGVKILGKGKIQGAYTGNFSREKGVEEALHFVCKSLGITFDKVKANEYQLNK